MFTYSFKEFFNPNFDYEMSDEAPPTSKFKTVLFWSFFATILILGG
jgi:hypothetical protein